MKQKSGQIGKKGLERTLKAFVITERKPVYERHGFSHYNVFVRKVYLGRSKRKVASQMKREGYTFVDFRGEDEPLLHPTYGVMELLRGVDEVPLVVVK